MNMRIARDIAYLCLSVIFFWIYIPHFIAYLISSQQNLIKNDLEELSTKLNIRLGNTLGLLFFLHNNSYFRTFFYHRIGAVWSFFISWWRPGCNNFIISKTTTIGGGALFAHPYATIINAESIGTNFSFRHLTTLGNKDTNNNRPIIGDNVTLGANVTIIGKITIGNNVTIGAGSIVIKSVADNCVCAGNPARVIRKIDKELHRGK